MIEPQPATHLADLLGWLDAIKLALDGMPLLNVRYADSPAALVVGVAPDPAGITTSVELIRHAQPTLALLMSPVPWADDEDVGYTLVLHGEDRIVIRCAPAPPLEPPDLHSQFGASPSISDEEWLRLSEGLTEMIQHIIETDPGWHPGTARRGASTRLIDTYLEEHPSDDPETVAIVASSAVIDRVLAAAQKKQVASHRAEWARNAEAIARQLLAGPDGDLLRADRAAREGLSLQHLQERDDTCAAGGPARLIASAITRVSRRVAPWDPTK